MTELIMRLSKSLTPRQAMQKCVASITSANPSGLPAATDAIEAHRYFPALPLLAPLPWPAGSGQASTVLAWQHHQHGNTAPPGWQVVRAGAFLPRHLQA